MAARRKKNVRQLLAEAYDQTRALRSQIAAQNAALANLIQPTEARAAAAERQVAELKGALEAYQRDADRRAQHRSLSDAEIVALSAVVLTETARSTPSIDRLVGELEHRGVLRERGRGAGVDALIPSGKATRPTAIEWAPVSYKGNARTVP